jgi:hypothetical protein
MKNYDSTGVGSLTSVTGGAAVTLLKARFTMAVWTSGTAWDSATQASVCSLKILALLRASRVTSSISVA